MYRIQHSEVLFVVPVKLHEYAVIAVIDFPGVRIRHEPVLYRGQSVYFVKRHVFFDTLETLAGSLLLRYLQLSVIVRLCL